MKTTQPRATFEVTQTEIGTGEPGYRWVTAFHIITPYGSKLYPPVVRREAIAICKREGWDWRAIIAGK